MTGRMACKRASLASAVIMLWPLVALGAPDFAIDWYTIGGGVQASFGGDFDLSGTIGQPDAGYMTGGDFELTGGFWGLPPRLPGDVDGDGDVDVFDVIALVNAFGSTSGDPNWDPRCDFDGNGRVDVFDAITIVNNFGTRQ